MFLISQWPPLSVPTCARDYRGNARFDGYWISGEFSATEIALISERLWFTRSVRVGEPFRQAIITYVRAATGSLIRVVTGRLNGKSAPLLPRR
jgi:hypothetical protein